MEKCRRQTFGLANGKGLVLDTPEGMVRITRDGRHITVECPGQMRVHKGEDRALKDARFTKGDGSPAYEVLIPKVDDSGALVGVAMPKPIVVSVA